MSPFFIHVSMLGTSVPSFPCTEVEQKLSRVFTEKKYLLFVIRGILMVLLSVASDCKTPRAGEV